MVNMTTNIKRVLEGEAVFWCITKKLIENQLSIRVGSYISLDETI